MWLLFAISAYLLLAAGGLVDRHLLVSPLPKPKVYAAFTGLLGGISFLLAPFGLKPLSFLQALLHLGAGAIWILALFFLYRALKREEASRTLPAVGGMAAVSSLLFSSLLFGSSPGSSSRLLALATLISGTLVLSTPERLSRFLARAGRFSVAGFLFGLDFALMKLCYTGQPFLSSFIWMRAGGFLVSLFLLGDKKVRKSFGDKKEAETLFSLGLLSQVLGGTGFLLQSYALFLAPPPRVPLINGLEGVRYAAVFLSALILHRLKPGLLEEKVSSKQVAQKIMGTLLVIVGIILSI